MDETYQLHSLSDEQRALALERFRIVRPALEENVSLSAIAQRTSITVRTLQRWRKNYLADGLAGLARKSRRDKGQFRTSSQFREAVEGLALKRPPLSAAAIARRAKDVAGKLNEEPPSYQSILRMVERIDPALKQLAHQGSNGYSDRYDLIHRTEASRPNAIWQADHTLLDILVDDNQKPWLTVILDDYSRAVAGYALSLKAPSSIQTALAYRQAIWVKSRAGWPVSGIPEIFYTDHGSDFTSNHLEQVAADLRTQLIFSAVGRPRGRGKIERFFRSINQVLLTRLPGYARKRRDRSRGDGFAKAVRAEVLDINLLGGWGLGSAGMALALIKVCLSGVAGTRKNVCVPAGRCLKPEHGKMFVRRSLIFAPSRGRGCCCRRYTENALPCPTGELLFRHGQGWIIS